MCPVLDPRIEHGGPPSLAMEDYQREHALALEDLKTLSMRRGLAANQAGAGAGAGGSGTGMGTGASTSGSQQGSSPVGTPQPQPLSQPQLRPQSQLQNRTGASPAPNSTGSPRPPASNATAPQGIGRPPIRPGPNPPLPEGLMALADVRKILGVANQEQRQAIFEKVHTIHLTNHYYALLTIDRTLVLKRNSAPRSSIIKLYRLRIKIGKMPKVEQGHLVRMVGTPIPMLDLQIQTQTQTHWHQHLPVVPLPLHHRRTPLRQIHKLKLRIKFRFRVKAIQSDPPDPNPRQPVRLLLQTRTQGITHMELHLHPTLMLPEGVYLIDHST
jgi:hypothetical protein